MPEWTKCDYILQNERPDLRFKAIVLSLIDQDSPKILEYLMNKCQILKVHSCQFTETMLKGTKMDKIYDLEVLHVLSTEIDLTFVQNQSGLANLKSLDMNESFLKVPENVKLSNL